MQWNEHATASSKMLIYTVSEKSAYTETDLITSPLSATQEKLQKGNTTAAFI